MSVAKTNGTVKKARATVAHSAGPLAPVKLSQLSAGQQAIRFLQAIALGGVIELRLLGCKAGHRKPFTVSGYFKNIPAAAKQIVSADEEYSPQGCYCTINPVDARLLARAPNQLEEYLDPTTSDHEIPARNELLVDIDPNRPSAISSDAGELAAARAVASNVRRILREENGWPEPITMVMSGNGVQLIYAIDLPNDKDTTKLIESVLRGLAQRFDNEQVKVDLNVANAARLVKVPGTTARKGADTPERPWRQATLLFMASKRRTVSHKQLGEVAAVVNHPGETTKPTNSTTKHPAGAETEQTTHYGRLDIPKYLEHYGTPFEEVAGQDSKGRRRWALEQCPFHPDHGGRDCVVLQEPSGKLCFKCFHDRCAGKGWKDVRTKIGPPLPEHYDRPPEDHAFRNYHFESVVAGDSMTTRAIALPSPQLSERLFSLTDGWPKRVGPDLFALDSDGRPIFFEDKKPIAAFFAWIERFASVSWKKGADYVPQDRFFAYLQSAAEEYDAVEIFPHHPPLPRIYYAAPEVPGSDGGALNGLLDRLSPATTRDRELMRAAVLTLVWGGPAGKRPLFVIAGPLNDDPIHQGRGTGKTTLVQTLSSLVGGSLSFSTDLGFHDMTKRILSPQARFLRVALLDNVKKIRFSWAELEHLITTDIISGHQMYAGEGRRLNTLTWFITMNGGRLSKDLAQRSVVIRVGRPHYDGHWDRAIQEYIEANRWRIITDACALLRPNNE